MNIDKKEWATYVAKVASGPWPVPGNLLRDYDNWLCRSMVGRALYFQGDIEGAMLVLSTVVDVVPSRKIPQEGMSEIEHKILCLRDLAKIIWTLTKNKKATEKFINEALELANNWGHDFHSLKKEELEELKNILK